MVIECKEHALTDISRTDTADGVRRLLHVWQCLCNVAGQYMRESQ
jgi:hypothetical protein